MPNAPLPQVGDVLVWHKSGQTYADVSKGQQVAYVSKRGTELLVTAAMIEVNRDRNGDLPSWLALAHDSDAQLARSGELVLAPGPWPDHLERLEVGSVEHADARRAAVREANALPTKAERRSALAAIERRYGPAEPTSRTNATYAR